MGGTCSDLALAENPCLIWTCVKSTTRVDDRLSWVLTLKSDTHYQGKLIEKVLGQLWVSSKQSIQYLSVLKRCVEQSVCPFFSYIYAVGHNCSVESLSQVFRENISDFKRLIIQSFSEKWLLVLQEPTQGTQLDAWVQKPVPFIEKVLVLFQLVFSCYVLQLAGLPFGVSFQNLRVSKGDLKKYAFYGNTEFVSYFHFETAFELQVVEYETLFQNGDNTDVITLINQQLFPGVSHSENVELSVIFMRLAKWLVNENIVAHSRVPRRSYNVYGVRGSFFVNKNLPRFTVNHETKYSEEMQQVMEPVNSFLEGLKEKKHDLVQWRLNLESQQKEIQSELQKFK